MATLALCAAGCGGTSKNASTGSAGSVASGSFAGTTSQGLPVSFTVTSGAIAAVQFGWVAKCADGQTHTNTILLGGGQMQNGAFSIGGTLDTGASSQFEGTVHGGSASGQLSRSGPSAFGTDCLDIGVKWSAHAG